MVGYHGRVWQLILMDPKPTLAVSATVRVPQLYPRTRIINSWLHILHILHIGFEGKFRDE